MNNKKLIRFAGSFLVLPMLTASIPLGILSNPKIDADISTTSQIVLVPQQNIEALNGLFAFNQALDQKAKELQAKAEAIDAYFGSKNLPLEGYGQKFVEESEKNNLDWRLLASIAMIETTGGKNLCKNPKGKNNPFGWGSCKIGFESFDEAIEVVARNLGGNNPDTEHHYAGEKTTKEILQIYNPPKVVSNYYEKVKRVMDEINANFEITAEV